MRERMVELLLILLAALLLTLGNAMDWQQANTDTAIQAGFTEGQRK